MMCIYPGTQLPILHNSWPDRRIIQSNTQATGHHPCFFLMWFWVIYKPQYSINGCVLRKNLLYYWILFFNGWTFSITPAPCYWIDELPYTMLLNEWNFSAVPVPCLLWNEVGEACQGEASRSCWGPENLCAGNTPAWHGLPRSLPPPPLPPGPPRCPASPHHESLVEFLEELQRETSYHVKS